MQERTRPLKVVITDDHAVVRSGYRRLLELEDGIEVVAEFSDGDATCRWLAHHEADVLILDLSMPGRSGLATLQRLRQRVPALRVLVFTMHDSVALASQALGYGASGYITKNSPPDCLVSAIRRVASGDRPLSDDVAEATESVPTPQSMPHLRLSPSELETFLLFAQGMDVEEVAARCSLNVKTAANYQTTVRRKTGLGSALEMYRYAQQHKLLKMGPAN